MPPEPKDRNMPNYTLVEIVQEDGTTIELYRRREGAHPPTLPEPWPETLKGSGLR
jgi:hypothetical protein